MLSRIGSCEKLPEKFCKIERCYPDFISDFDKNVAKINTTYPEIISSFSLEF